MGGGFLFYGILQVDVIVKVSKREQSFLKGSEIKIKVLDCDDIF